MKLFNIFKKKPKKPLRQQLEERFLVYTEGGKIYLGDFSTSNWDGTWPDFIGSFDTVEAAEKKRQKLIKKEIKRREPRVIMSK